MIMMVRVIFTQVEILQFFRKITGLDLKENLYLRPYKMTPTRNEYLDWHTDSFAKYMLGVVINLSNAPYEGGLFQIRRKNSSEYKTIHNISPWITYIQNFF